MAQTCGLSDHNSISADAAPVHLVEDTAQVLLGHEGSGGAGSGLWYLDTGASNHMTGDRAVFAELDTAVTGTVKFGDGSVVNIRGRGTILLACITSRGCALT